MKKHLQYLSYVLRHKWYVFWACLQIGGLRLLWRGIIHDWSKFLPSEWRPYAQYFYGDNSKEYFEHGGWKGEVFGHYGIYAGERFNIAWNHHQKRNDHHWQYWVLMQDDGGEILMPMPDVCRKEMLADWIGAGKALGKPKTWEWYEANKSKIKLREETRLWVEEQLEAMKVYHRQYERFRTLGF